MNFNSKLSAKVFLNQSLLYIITLNHKIMCRIIALIILSSLCYNCHNIAPMLKKRNQQDKVTSKDLDQQLMKKEQNSHSHKWNSKSNSFFLQDIEKTALPKSHYSRRKLLETTGNFKKIRHDLICQNQITVPEMVLPIPYSILMLPNYPDT